MTPEHKIQLEKWLLSGSDREKALAQHRLAMNEPIEEEKLMYPPLWEQAGNFAAAMGRAITTGFASVDEAEQDRRLAICHQCEFFDHQQARCTKCGCFGKFKSWLASEHCPIQKW